MDIKLIIRAALLCCMIFSGCKTSSESEIKQKSQVIPGEPTRVTASITARLNQPWFQDRTIEEIVGEAIDAWASNLNVDIQPDPLGSGNITFDLAGPEGGEVDCPSIAEVCYLALRPSPSGSDAFLADVLHTFGLALGLTPQEGQKLHPSNLSEDQWRYLELRWGLQYQ